jgi:hypothetical protein
LALKSEPAMNHFFSCCAGLSHNIFCVPFILDCILKHTGNKFPCIARGQVESLLTRKQLLFVFVDDEVQARWWW